MDSFEENKRIVEERKKKNSETRSKNHKAFLEKNIVKKIRTTMIGALADFEKHFGYMWKHGSDYVELEEEDLEMRDLWEEVRNSILDRGNNQIWAAKNEISEYDVNRNRHETRFNFTRDN